MYGERFVRSGISFRERLNRAIKSSFLIYSTAMHQPNTDGIMFDVIMTSVFCRFNFKSLTYYLRFIVLYLKFLPFYFRATYEYFLFYLKKFIIYPKYFVSSVDYLKDT